MDRERLRIWIPGLVVLASVFACPQLAIVRALQSEREAALEQQLRELRREGHQLEARRSRELSSARLQAQRLRAGLARSRALGASLRMELADARASASRLRQRAETAAEVLGSEPPPLGVRIAPSTPLDGLVAVADNVGRHPIRIAEAQGRLWIGDREAWVERGAGGLDVGPGEELDFFEFQLLEGEAGPVADGAVALRGALCVVYTRGLDSAATPWAREIWFEYRPRPGSAVVLDQDRWAPWQGEVACQLEVASLPW